jgi:hypothetical protein
MRTERQQLKIKTISYKRTKQTKPYEPEVIELIIDLAPGETPEEVINRALLLGKPLKRSLTKPEIL